MISLNTSVAIYDNRQMKAGNAAIVVGKEVQVEASQISLEVW